MVLSGFTLSLGAERFFSGGIIFRRIFNLDGRGAFALVFGALCGFPVGAKCAIELYEKGSLTKKEAELLLPLSNLTGPGFALGSVGLLLGSSSAGWILYALQIVMTLTVCAVFAPRASGNSHALKYAAPNPHPPSLKKNLPEVFTDAVKTSSLSCLYICGYVVFFSCLSCAVGRVLFPGGESNILQALLSCFFEVGAGVAAASVLERSPGIPLCAFAIGFSGLSVICQIASLNKSGLSLKPLISLKLLSGALCAAAAYILLILGIFH